MEASEITTGTKSPRSLDTVPSVEVASCAAPEGLSFPGLGQCPASSLCGDQEGMSAWKCREGIALGLPKASICVNSIFASPDMILLVKMMDGFHARKLKIVSSQEQAEPRPSWSPSLPCPA